MDRLEETVSEFTALLGTNKPSGHDSHSSIARSILSKPETSPSASRCRKLSAYLSPLLKDETVICTIPSLDMQKLEDTGLDLLPKVGEHHFPMSLEASSADVSSEEGRDSEKDRPPMDASVLGNAADASAKAAQLEQKATQSLGSLSSWTKSSVIYAPTAISTNVSSSFSSLVDSRVRAWTLLLLRHSLTTGDSDSRSRLLSMLSSIIKVEAAHTTFKTLPLPQSAVGQPKESDVILPLLFEVELSISIQLKSDKITLRAPGTVSGESIINGAGGLAIIQHIILNLFLLLPFRFSFAHYEANFSQSLAASGKKVVSGLSKVDIRLDTGALLESMVQQARMIVFKAVAKATSASEISKPSEVKVDFRKKLSLGSRSTVALSGLGNSLEATHADIPRGKHQPLHRLQKARSSALKLNSVLQGSSGKQHGMPPLDKTRKSRSIQWDTANLPKMKSPVLPSPKRQRVAHTSARLASFKSFGRPHAGDFGSGPKNATFGDFGRKPIWGRDGKLANHPQPMQSSEHQTQDLLSGPGPKSSKNATFDFQRPSIHLSSGLDLRAATKKRPGLNRVPSSIPRTATALEGWLMKSANM